VELRVHDFVWITKNPVFRPLDAPAWVAEVFAQSRVVVVRRAAAPQGWLSVGIRGPARHQRHSCFLRQDGVESLHSPEILASSKLWKTFSHSSRGLSVWKALRLVSDYFTRRNLIWGPIGSVGYGLATGIDVLTEMSDLDIIVRFSAAPNLEILKELRQALRFDDLRVDVTLESSMGGVDLNEYLSHPDSSLIKTSGGPRVGGLLW
jgi:phosphoribosyl-dephospho-CoA transferase